MRKLTDHAVLCRANRATNRSFYYGSLPPRLCGVRVSSLWILMLAAAMATLSACGGSSSSGQQPSAKLAGNWQFAMKSPDPNYNSSFQFGLQGGFLLQQNGSVTGQAVYSVAGQTNPNGAWAVCNSGTATITGTISGQTVNLTVVAGTQSSTPPSGQTYTLQNGTLSADGSTISGTFTATGGTATAWDGSTVTCGMAGTSSWTASSVPPLTGTINGSFYEAATGATRPGGLTPYSNSLPVTGSLIQGQNIGASNATVTGTLNFVDPTTGLSDNYPCIPNSVSVNGQISGNSVILYLIANNGSTVGQIGIPASEENNNNGFLNLYPVTIDPTTRILSSVKGYGYGVSTSTCPASSGPGGSGPICLALNSTTACQQPILVAPAALTFPSQIVGEAQAPLQQTITITNNSSITQNGLKLFFPTGDFTAASNTCGTGSFTLYPPGSVSGPSSCALTISFAPQEDDCEADPFGSGYPYGSERPGLYYTGHAGKPSPVCPPLSTALFVNGITGSPDQATSLSVPITGYGFSAIQASTPEIDFDAWAPIDQNSQTPAPSQTLTFTNSGSDSQTISGPGPCVLSSLGAPTSASAGLQVVLINAEGSLTCASGSPSTTNYQIVPGSDNCSGTALAPGDSCSVAIEYTPVVGTYGAAGTSYFLQLNTDEINSGRSPVELNWNQNSPLRMSVNGTPVPGAIAMLNFGNQLARQASSPQTITLYNDPNDPSNSSQFNPQANPLAFPAKPAVKGNYSEYDDCLYYLPVGQNCTMTVTFTPTSAGFAPGLITIYVQAGTSLTGYSYPQYVYLLGAGQ